MHIFQRIIAVILAGVAVLAAFVFASLLLAVLVAAGAVTWLWLWWRTRKAVRAPRADGEVIEGEFRDVTPESDRLEQR